MSKAPSLLIVGPEPRKRGRPRAEREMSSVSTWIWSRHHDVLIKQAERRGVSVSAHVREILEKVAKYPV